MGRSTWTARSCRTCLKRKIKCDKVKPHCRQCQASSRKCEGYSQLVNQTLLSTITPYEHKPLSACQHWTQLLSLFLTDYLPVNHSPRQVQYCSSVSWVETFPKLMNSNLHSICGVALTALILVHNGRAQKNEVWVREGEIYYSSAVEEICSWKRIMDPSEVIRTAMVLALYEAYTSYPREVYKWRVHVRAACNFATESSLYKPDLGLRKYDIYRLETIQFLSSFMLDHEEAPWQSFSNIFEKAGQHSTDIFGFLLNILPEVSQMYEEVKHMQEIDNSTSATCPKGLLHKCLDTEKKLLGWYKELTSVHDGPLFLFTKSPSGEKNSHSISIKFPNTSIIPHLMIYWLSMVMTYTCICTAILAGAESFQNSFQIEEGRLKKRGINDFISLYTHYILHISQSQLECMNRELGIALISSATSLAVLQTSSISNERLSGVFDSRRDIDFVSEDPTCYSNRPWCLK
ncbi:hypothetical protein BGW36DRAFT_382454 [Talaromyces proteolyticus]|uniref:Zn(2)-C6 fungal-type domain-containing protein n=1 Tax=Talaromyces proteolyticus TaxID=1131652 RepID=A0AAD4KLD4_9EURO|nr:uncharacterized protein BGW36DRAFT_382454 [Talaromyces proteolyticus]KAH8695299.1 hypothetical protein BGW36DRAFT_382454 [Talaromyces proteolyticus]